LLLQIVDMSIDNLSILETNDILSDILSELYALIAKKNNMSSMSLRLKLRLRLMSQSILSKLKLSILLRM